MAYTVGTRLGAGGHWDTTREDRRYIGISAVCGQEYGRKEETVGISTVGGQESWKKEETVGISTVGGQEYGKKEETN